MSDGKSEAMVEMAQERTSRDRDSRGRECEVAIQRLELAIQRLNSFYLGGGTEVLKQAREYAGEGVRKIGEMMTERGL